MNAGVHNPTHLPTYDDRLFEGAAPSPAQEGRPGAGRRPNDGRASSVEMDSGLSGSDVLSPNPCQSHSSRLLVAGPCMQGRSNGRTLCAQAAGQRLPMGGGHTQLHADLLLADDRRGPWQPAAGMDSLWQRLRLAGHHAAVGCLLPRQITARAADAAGAHRSESHLCSQDPDAARLAACRLRHQAPGWGAQPLAQRTAAHHDC